MKIVLFMKFSVNFVQTANILQSKGAEKGKCFCLISADMMTKNQCNSLGLALIGMRYENKKNAYL